MSTTLTGQPIAEVYLADYSQYRYTSRAVMAGIFNITQVNALPRPLTDPTSPFEKLSLTECGVECRDGVAYYEWIYEGVSDIFFDGRTKLLELNGGTQQEPITSHPRIGEFIAQYSKGFSAGRIQWLLRDPTGNSTVTGLTGPGGGVTSNINPLLGVDSYLSPTASYSYEEVYADRASIPSDLLSGLGKIADSSGADAPPDVSSRFSRSGAAAERDWLKSGVELIQVGDAYVSRTHYLLSGVGGWLSMIYR
jgi:hypothetical protein